MAKTNMLPILALGGAAAYFLSKGKKNGNGKSNLVMPEDPEFQGGDVFIDFEAISKEKTSIDNPKVIRLKVGDVVISAAPALKREEDKTWLTTYSSRSLDDSEAKQSEKNVDVQQPDGRVFEFNRLDVLQPFDILFILSLISDQTEYELGDNQTPESLARFENIYIRLIAEE